MKLYDKMKDWYYIIKDDVECLVDGFGSIITNEEDIYTYNTCTEIYNKIVKWSPDGTPYIDQKEVDEAYETYFGNEYIEFIDDVIKSIN